MEVEVGGGEREGRVLIRGWLRGQAHDQFLCDRRLSGALEHPWLPPTQCQELPFLPVVTTKIIPRRGPVPLRNWIALDSLENSLQKGFAFSVDKSWTSCIANRPGPVLSTKLELNSFSPFNDLRKVVTVPLHGRAN